MGDIWTFPKMTTLYYKTIKHFAPRAGDSVKLQRDQNGRYYMEVYSNANCVDIYGVGPCAGDKADAVHRFERWAEYLAEKEVDA